MKKKLLAVIIAAMAVFAGCAEEEAPTVQTIEGKPIEKETQAEEETETQEESGEEAVSKDGKQKSYLTGEWKDEEIVKRRNMAVMMPNNKLALPQYGISQASIIYEAPVEGRVTRLMAMFEDYDDLKYIGPVRSSRDYYVYEAMAFDSIYVNWGLAIPFVGPIINTDRIDNVSQALTGIDVGAPEAFDRISRPGYATEFTGYLMIDGYEDAVERLGYETEYTDRFVKTFTFAEDGKRAEYKDYPDAVKIYPGGTDTNSSGYGNAKPVFEYDESDGLYYRSQYGKKHVDEMNGEQIAVSNIVFKVCHGEVREPVDKDYLAFGVHGKGDAYVFTNGKVIQGTWKRDGDYEPNVFYDQNGNEIIFNQGKTWICNIWDKYEDCILYE